MKTMLFGPIDNMKAIPCPETGMDWSFENDSEVTELDSGGRHVYTAPTGFKTFGMNFTAGTKGLEPLIDIFNGAYGPGPYYLNDPNYTTGNVLPTRWASAHKLGYIADGWCAPIQVVSTGALAKRDVRFENTGRHREDGPTLIVPRVPDKTFYVKVWGTRTGTASVKVYTQSGSGWVLAHTIVPAAGGSVEVTATTSIKLELVCPSGSTLTLDHINVTTATSSVREPGRGVGPVKFTNTLSGSIQTKRYDRIGLSLDLMEVE